MRFIFEYPRRSSFGGPSRNVRSRHDRDVLRVCRMRSLPIVRRSYEVTHFGDIKRLSNVAIGPKKNAEKKAALGRAGKQARATYKSSSRKVQVELRQLDPKQGDKLVHKLTMNAAQAKELQRVMPSLSEVFQKVMGGLKEAKITTYASGHRLAIAYPYWCLNFSKWSENRLVERMSLKIHEFRELKSFLEDPDVKRILGEVTEQSNIVRDTLNYSNIIRLDI